MSTIREDVVSIGFEVENDPCADLTAGMDEIRAELGTLTSVESGLNDIGRSAASAANQMDSLTNSIHAPPDMGNPLSGLTEGLESVTENSSAIDQLNDGLNKTGDNASDAGEQVDDLAEGLRGLSVDDVVAGTKKLASGVVKVGSTLAHPKRSIKELADNAKKFAKEKLDAGVKKLPAPLQIAVTVSGALLGKLKQIAGVQLGKVASGVKKIGESAVSAGKTAVKGVASGMVAATKATRDIGLSAIKVGSGFESSMSQVAATMGMSADQANYSNEEYAKLAKTAKEMGAATKFSASESAEALNYMALAGYDADKACGALPTVLNLASAGGMDLASASDMVTDSMSALGIEATQENLTSFGDQLAKTSQKSNTSVAQLGEAVLTVGGTAKTLAGGTTELNTLLGIIADNGVKGAEGGTALRNIMLSLQAPTDTAAKKMKNLGLNVYTAEGKMRPMNDILNDLNASMDGMSDQKKQDILSTIFNKNDLKSVNALLANSGERFDELSGLIENSDGAMKDMADTMNDNLTGRITEFQSATEGAGIAIYEALGSSNLKDAVQKASGWMSDLTKATEEGGLSGLAEALGTVAGKAITEVTAHLPKLIDTGTQIIQSLLTGIDQNRDQIAQGLVSGLTSGITGLLQITPQILTVGVAMFSSLLQGMESQTPAILDSAMMAINSLCQGLLDNGPAIMQSGVNILLQLATGLVSYAPMLLTSGIQLIAMLAQGIGSGFPQVVQQLPTLISDLVSGLISAAPQIGEAGMQLIEGLVSAITSINWLDLGANIIKGIGSGIVNGIKGIFGKGKDSGKEVADGIASGFEANSGALSSAVQSSAQKATQSFKPDLTQLNGCGLQMPTAVAQGITNGTPLAITAATEQMTQMETTVQSGFSGLVADAGTFSSNLKNEIDRTDLYSSGVNIMAGLNNGMNSMRSTIMSTARSIASEVAQTVNTALDIHSPSRVMKESGRFVDLGLAKGMQDNSVTVQRTAQSVAVDLKKAMNTSLPVSARVESAPIRSQYTPESFSITNNRTSSSQVNTYNPVFNMTLNGASASDSNERKVKRWVREAIREAMEGMGRTNPRLREV